MNADLATRSRSTYEEFVRLFSNVLFAVSLFAVWGLLTLLGVVVEQGKDVATYFSQYPAPIARCILRLGLDNVYHSPQYLGVVGLILLSLAVCTFKRVIPARLPPLRRVKIAAIPLNATVEIYGNESDVRQRIAAFFASRGWTIRKRDFDGEEWMFADRYNWARRGVLVAHVGFVIIAVGTTIYWWKGYSGATAIVSGQSVTIPQTGLRITLDRFGYRYDPIKTKSGIVYQPVDYVSNVTIDERGRPPRRATIRVNAPLDVDGTLYYQASYGYAVSFGIGRGGMILPTEYIKEGEGFPLSGGPPVRFAQFVPTFDPATGRAAPDPRPNHPAVVLAEGADDQPDAALLPMGKTLAIGQGWTITPLRYALFTGLQYRYDPGMPLVAIGAFVLLSGLCIAFYFLPARLFVIIEGAGRNWRVGIAATTVKGYDIFEEQFAQLILALGATAEPSGAVLARTATESA